MIFNVDKNMETVEKTQNEKKSRNKPTGKPKNLLDCKIACVAKKSRFKPTIKKVRLSSTSVFPLELPEYQDQSYVKKYTCPKCMGNIEITVRPEKAGSLYYKLIIMGFILIFIIVNAAVLQNADLSSSMTTILEINAIILGSMIGLLFLILLNNYVKTRTKRSIRLKIKANSSMAHKLYKSRRKEFNKKTVKV